MSSKGEPTKKTHRRSSGTADRALIAASTPHKKQQFLEEEL